MASRAQQHADHFVRNLLVFLKELSETYPWLPRGGRVLIAVVLLCSAQSLNDLKQSHNLATDMLAG
eukprot:CAMPEP_0115872262 /NCGR_PEP_ID=MMETSP0287-20121206/23325_1 /TAXON_ID=412157 /ORGANISM="Chrysochromulina rotalis, Strain UIO044" /LENGTH=65 /DNA_ID=CAMNT_0003327157 /DNA_START=256 /DNA_END=453 /DNA_ORIENTATION=+